MLCLVSDGIHSNQTSYAAANHRNAHKGCFGKSSVGKYGKRSCISCNVNGFSNCHRRNSCCHGAGECDKHYYTSGDCRVCKVAAKSAEEAFYDDDCDELCNECNVERTAPHKWENACDAECNECGYIRVPSEHVYDNDCDSACNICGETRATEHNYEAVVTAPTCTEKGYSYAKCSRCDSVDEKEIEEMYRANQETAVSTQKDIASAYEHYLTKRYNKVKESLQKEQEAYQEAYAEENFERELSKQQQVLDELAQEIAIYERDTSLAGQARLEQLKQEYIDQQEAINDMIRDNEYEKTNEAFADQEESLDEELADLLAPENLVKTVNDAIASGMITVGDSVMTLDSLMSSWIDETGDGLYALGDILKGELVDNLANAQKILGEMGILKGSGSISLASSSALLSNALSNGVSNMSSASISFDAPLLYVQGNVDSSVMDEITKALKEAEQNIYKNIANSSGGKLNAELQPFQKYVESTPITDFFHDEWYKEKFVIYLPL